MARCDHGMLPGQCGHCLGHKMVPAQSDGFAGMLRTEPPRLEGLQPAVSLEEFDEEKYMETTEAYLQFRCKNYAVCGLYAILDRYGKPVKHGMCKDCFTKKLNEGKARKAKERESLKPENLQDLLLLVGVEVPQKDIERWSLAERRRVAKWAAAVYLKASGNSVRVPKKPDFLAVYDKKKDPPFNHVPTSQSKEGVGEEKTEPMLVPVRAKRDLVLDLEEYLGEAKDEFLKSLTELAAGELRSVEAQAIYMIREGILKRQVEDLFY